MKKITLLLSMVLLIISARANRIPAPFFGDTGSNDEFKGDPGPAIASEDTYDYATGFRFGNQAFVYGGFGGIGYGITNASGVLTVISADKSLNIKVLLEGLYNGGGTMRKAQNATGNQFSGTTADQVTLELINATNGSVVYTLSNVYVSTSGNISATVHAEYSGSYYIYVRHRNSITTSTAVPLSFAGTTITYDFTNLVTKAYGSNMALMSGGWWAIYGGDAGQDGLIDYGDMIPVDNGAAIFARGYIPEDITGDGLVDSSDMILIENNAVDFEEAILPFQWYP